MRKTALFVIVAFAFCSAVSAYNLYANTTAVFPPVTSAVPNATQFGLGTALSYNGDVAAVVGIDRSGTPFAAIYYLLVNGSYGLGQVITGNKIGNFSVYSTYVGTFGILPVRFSANADVLVWGWTNYGAGITWFNYSQLGEVYVYYFNNGSYQYSQTLREPVTSLPTNRSFGTDARLSATGQLLLVSAPLIPGYGNIGTSTDRVYAYQLAANGTAWPPVYNNIGFISHVYQDDAWGASYEGQTLAADGTMNTVAVSADYYKPPGSSGVLVGAVFLYAWTSAGSYAQINVFTNNNGVHQPEIQFGASVDIDPSNGQLVVGQPITNTTNAGWGAAWAYGLNPFTGNHSSGQNLNLLNNTAVSIATQQGWAVAASGHNARVIAVGAPEQTGNPQGSVFIWERNSTSFSSPVTYNLTNTLRPFGPPSLVNYYLQYGYYSISVSQDNSTVLVGAGGELPTQDPGSAYFYRSSPSVQLPGPACNLNLANVLSTSFDDGIRCDASPSNGYAFNLSSYFASNPSANPCANQTSGAGTVYSYSSFPPGFVTSQGVITGDNGSLCSADYSLVSVWFSCTAAASWDCLPFAGANVAQDPAANNAARPTLQTLNNVFFVYGTAELPSGLSAGAIAGIVIAGVAVLVALIVGLWAACNSGNGLGVERV